MVALRALRICGSPSRLGPLIFLLCFWVGELGCASSARAMATSLEIGRESVSVATAARSTCQRACAASLFFALKAPRLHAPSDVLGLGLLMAPECVCVQLASPRICGCSPAATAGGSPAATAGGGRRYNPLLCLLVCGLLVFGISNVLRLSCLRPLNPNPMESHFGHAMKSPFGHAGLPRNSSCLSSRWLVGTRAGLYIEHAVRCAPRGTRFLLSCQRRPGEFLWRASATAALNRASATAALNPGAATAEARIAEARTAEARTSAIIVTAVLDF